MGGFINKKKKRSSPTRGWEEACCTGPMGYATITASKPVRSSQRQWAAWLVAMSARGGGYTLYT